MSLLVWLRNLLAGPSHVRDDEKGEVEAALSEEYDTPSSSDTSLKRMEQASRLLPNSEAAGAAAEDLESLEAPPDPDP
jgi:hypothetical protein